MALRVWAGSVLLVTVIIAALVGAPERSRRAATASTPAPPAQTDASGHDISGHDDSEGLKLIADTSESVRQGATCKKGAPMRQYDVVAIDVDMTLNRWLDHDPKGHMYALADDVSRIRAEEQRNAAARGGRGEPAVSIGEQGDAIQPLTLRVLPGECLRILFTNQLQEPASIHIHGSTERVEAPRRAATAANKEALADPNRTISYLWQVGDDEPEGTHYFHSHGPEERALTNHGLFGSIIVEPAGSTWLSPRSDDRIVTGWDARVQQPNGPSFREFVLYYHEIGTENEQLTDRNGQLVPLVDPITHAYRPDGRALNYRSEPFLDRLQLGQSVSGRADESLEYSSYAFGDPATPVMRSYLGDPVKQRVVHGGSEVFHVHHVHGGSIRWHRQSDVEPTHFADGFTKTPPLTPQRSELTDSQTLGPSETFDVVDECGSGGCQQSPGDFLYHCHVAEHYFAGMWGIWRVYNTLQDGAASTDTLPALDSLPARPVDVKAAVPSNQLTAAQQAAIGAQLPPAGVPGDDDATVLDWKVDNGVVVGEPEDAHVWPYYHSATPGKRPAMVFDPVTGKPAYPFLKPHLAKRPPFSPNHSPAPYLDPVTPHSGTDPPAPGAHPTSICPTGTKPRQFAINAITLPVTLNQQQDIVDSQGELFVLRSQEDAVRQNPALQAPLALRTNAGEDCVDVLLRSELRDNADVPFSKVGLHIHFMQFDVQASDGVNTGFNYEQTVRPYTAEGGRLGSGAPSGATALVV